PCHLRSLWICIPKRGVALPSSQYVRNISYKATGQTIISSRQGFPNRNAGVRPSSPNACLRILGVEPTHKKSLFKSRGGWLAKSINFVGSWREKVCDRSMVCCLNG
ncbi:MAG: hypothetical protein MUD08_19655, partial [Cytophagales bacterium]|nr:hypothetical protein [Cytophagales bacterium]